MNYGIRRSILAATLAVCLGAPVASAKDADSRNQDGGEGQKEQSDQGRAPDPYGEPRRAPDGSGDAPTGDALEPEQPQQPAPVVETEPKTGVYRRTDTVEQPPVQEDRKSSGGGEPSLYGGNVAKGTFTDSDGTGWNYCSGTCKKVTQKIKRAGGKTDNVIRITNVSCACSCVLFKSTGGKLEFATDDSYLNIGSDSPGNYSLRCCEED